MRRVYLDISERKCTPAVVWGSSFARATASFVRTVALKEIQPDHSDNPHYQERFIFEAEVTGSLEHPGIVPVYGLGRYSDDRPYYAMRFIRGRSFFER